MIEALIKITISIAIFLGLDTCQNKPFIYSNEKLKGICMVAPRQAIEVKEFEKLKKINANWVALMPYGFLKEGNPEFQYNKDSKPHFWWGESPEGVAACVKMAHTQGLKVMLKPHVWIMGNKENVFTGDFTLKTDAEWQIFEQSYRNYLLHFAKIADSTHVELFCMATEFKTFVAQRPTFWKEIIQEIKKNYKGKLTYAENWDSFEQVPFWKDLDFIGVDAYFPLSDQQKPSKETLMKAWLTHELKLEKLSRKLQKPILFAEIGYQYTDFATKKPWETAVDLPDNENIQATAYEAFFEQIWQKKWFAGCFIWKWFPETIDEKGKKPFKHFQDKYSPQGKVAESILKSYFQ